MKSVESLGFYKVLNSNVINFGDRRSNPQFTTFAVKMLPITPSIWYTGIAGGYVPTYLGGELALRDVLNSVSLPICM